MGKVSLRRALVALSLLAAVPALGGCAAPSSYAGIPLAQGAADGALQELARRARAGDKQAQLELGMRYEEGRGLPNDLRQAERLYAAAAQATGGARLAYVPASGRNRAMTVSISSGPAVAGLPHAAERLARLRSARTLPPPEAADGPSGGDGPVEFPAAPNVARQAFAELVLLDYAHQRCTRGLPSGYAGTRPVFERMRACFRSAALPPECRDYYPSIRNVAELVAIRTGLAPLARAAEEMLLRCAGGAPSSRAESRSPTRLDLTAIELLLGREPLTPPSQPSEHYDPTEAQIPASAYLGNLCDAVVDLRLDDFSTADLLLCSDTSEFDSRVDNVRRGLRRFLNLRD